MTEHKIDTPLKVGLLIVVASYFLFTLHAMFTLQWWGEWNFSGQFNFGVFITDIAALPGLVARFIGSLIALVIVALIIKKGQLQSSTYKLHQGITNLRSPLLGQSLAIRYMGHLANISRF